MNSIIQKLPAYGMPVADGPVGRPAKKENGPPMDDGLMGGPGGPGMGGPKILKPSFPAVAPHLDPNSVPGSDIEDPSAPGPGFGGPPKAPPFDRVESISVINGKAQLAPEPYAQINGEITNLQTDGLQYITTEPCLNGIYIASEHKDAFTISNAHMEMHGDGINDFAGIGSAVMADETAQVTLRDSTIETWGCIRPATCVTGNAVMEVRNCRLIGHTGELPKTYVRRIASGMMEPPPGLEIGGTGRTHLSMGNSKAFFYDSYIYTRDWAALSTDGSQGDLHLEAHNCDVVCEGIGYGTYADNGCYNYLFDSRITSGSHAAIIAGEANVSFTNCSIKAGSYVSMIHSVRGSTSEVTTSYIRGGSAEAGTAIFFIKSTNAYVNAIGADLKAPYIIKSEINRDNAKTPVSADERFHIYGIKAYLQDMTLEGDICHEEDQRAMAVTLVNVRLTGGIHDAYVTLNGSDWTATKDSSVCFVGLTDLNAVNAPEGVTITAKAGDGCQLQPGTYNLKLGGKLVVS